MSTLERASSLMKLLLLYGLLVSHLTTVFLGDHWRRDCTVIVHVERDLVMHVTVKLNLTIHKLWAKNIVVLILHRLTCIMLPARNFTITEHLHLLLEMLRLCLVLGLLLSLLLLLWNVLRQMIYALQFNHLLMRDLWHLLLIVLLLLRGLQVNHLIVCHPDLLALIASLGLTRECWQLHLHLLLVLFFSFSWTFLWLVGLTRIRSITLSSHLAIDCLELIEILYL